MNNLVEQVHRKVKRRIYPMPGFKKFANASVTLSGIELVQKNRKGQFDTSAVIVREGMRMSHLWDAALSA